MGVRTHPIYSNFTGGEVSPKMAGRIDWDKWQAGCVTMENLTIMPQGGAMGRPGSLFVKEVKSSSTAVRLIPFRSSDTDRYVLEFGNKYVRVYKDGARVESGGVPVEIVTPYASTDLFDIHYGQMEDVLVLVHQSYAPRKLARFSDTEWRMNVLTFSPPPSYEYGTRPYPIGDTDSATVFGGIGPSSIATFTVDKASPQPAGTTITFTATATGGTAPYSYNFWAYYAGAWTELQAWSTTNTYAWTPGDTGATYPVLVQVWAHDATGPTVPPIEAYSTFNYTITSATTPTLTPAAVTGLNIALTAGADIFLASDVGRVIIAGLASATITVVDSATQVHVDIVDDFPDINAIAADGWHIQDSPMAVLTPSDTGPVGSTITVSLSIAGFRAADVGKYLLLSGGVVKITVVNSDGLGALATVLVELDSTTSQDGGAWSMEEDAWSFANGYPSTVGFFEGRMLFGGSTEERNGIWASASQDLTNFALGATDDASISIKANSGESSTIRWFSPRRTLLMGTSSDEYTITGGSDAAITPSNIRIRPATPHGSSMVMPIRAEHATLFLTGNKRLLREMAYEYSVDDYRSPDLLAIAEHLTTTTSIVDMAYQRPPESTVWCVRSDGSLLALSYLRDQEIVGWHRHVTTGLYESVCTIPSTDGTTEQVWVVVNRTIGGATKRYIEYFDPQSTFHSTTVRGLRTDSCVLQTATVATTTVTGLSHLEGETVSIVGDGSVYPNAIVASGSVTLSGPAALKIEVGLPFTCTLKPNRPEVPVSGTSQGLTKSWGNITVRLKDTQGAVVNDERIPWRTSGDVLGTAPSHFTGDKKVTNLGWDTDAYITIVQDKPCHIEVLAITGVLVVGD